MQPQQDVSRETPDEPTRATARKSNLGYLLARHIASVISNAWAYLGGKREEQFISLHVYRRGENDYLAVMKREPDDGGQAEVVFGSGIDFATALQAVNTAVTNNKWRKDKVK